VIFQIRFGNPFTGEMRTVRVSLTAEEVEAACRHKHPDLAREAYALRHGYKQVPLEFMHCRDGIKQLMLN
jgi:hypothetical protein